MTELKIIGFGSSQGGAYQQVEIAGCGEINGNVTTPKLSGSGTLKVNGSVDTTELAFSGACTINGDTIANKIDTAGSLQIKGRTTFDEAVLDGATTIQQNVKGSTLHVNGSLKVEQNIAVETMTVNGGVTVLGETSVGTLTLKTVNFHFNEIHADIITIKKPFFCVFKKSNHKVDIIECTSIHAEILHCKVLSARDVKLSKNCYVEHLEYSGKLEIEQGATIKEIIKL